MDQAFLESVINGLGAGIAALLGRLGGIGGVVGEWLLLIEITLLFAGMLQGGIAVVPIIKVLAVTGISAWALESLPDIVMGGIQVARTVIGGLLDRYSGPGMLFSFAIEVASRIVRSSLSFSPTGFWDAVADIGSLIVTGPIVFVVFLCLLSAGVMALFAEMEFMMSGLLAPLILPFVLFSGTRGMGLGAARIMFVGFLRILSAGAYAFLFNNTIVEHFPENWATQSQPSPTFGELLTLLAVSVSLAAFGFYVYRLPDKVVGYLGSHSAGLHDRVADAVKDGMKAVAGSAASAAGSAYSAWTGQAANNNAAAPGSGGAASSGGSGSGGGVGVSSNSMGGGARSPFVKRG